MARLPGRAQRFGANYYAAPFESNDVPGELLLVAGAALGAIGTAVSPNETPGAVALVGGAAVGLVGTAIPLIAPIVLQGNANLVAGANAIFAAECRMVGNANLLAAGLGGTPATVNPTDRNSVIVAVGIRGGHS